MRAHGDQVVDQHAEIGLVAPRPPGGFPLGAASGVDARQQALGAGFLVTRRAVDLTGEEQVVDKFGFQRVLQITWIEEIVLDGVAGPGDMGVFQSGDRAHDLQLHVERQGSGNPVRIELVGIQAFGLDEHLVAGLVGETVDLVLDRRAVARPHAFDHAGIHRRTVEIGEDDLVGPLVGMRDMAIDLARMLFAAAQIRHHRQRRVAGLWLEPGEIDTLGIDTRRRPGLQPIDTERQRTQTFGQRVGRRIAGATAGMMVQPDVDHASQEGTGTQHHGIRHEADAGLGPDTDDGVVFHNQIVDALLEQSEISLVFQDAANRGLVSHAIRLGSSGANRRPLAGIEHTKLDAGQVGCLCHGTTQGIDLLDQMALADPADGGIAGHLAQRLDVMRQQQGAGTATCRCQSGFGTGMTTADHDDLKTVGILHGLPHEVLETSSSNRHPTVNESRKAAQYKPPVGNRQGFSTPDCFRPSASRVITK